MGFYIRKSFTIGPLRLNLSRSGLGASVGTKGARLGLNAKGRLYTHLGRWGLYHRQDLGSVKEQPGPASKGIGFWILIVLGILLALSWRSWWPRPPIGLMSSTSRGAVPATPGLTREPAAWTSSTATLSALATASSGPMAPGICSDLTAPASASSSRAPVPSPPACSFHPESGSQGKTMQSVA
jgi:hypothetical protein